ncbi:MAG: hypothetical protein JNK04_11675 [Myxococcales bacterium]|nr:hypothetical protein [Myxococcales bacterium]
MRWAALLVTALLGCGDDTSATGGGNAGGSGQGGDGNGGAASGGDGPIGAGDCSSHSTSPSPDFDATEGLFTIRVETGETDFAIFGGSVHSPPSAGFQTEEARQGQCRLLTFTQSNCTPACDFGAFCIDGECVTPTAAIDAGTLTLSGVVADPVTADDGGIGIYYWSSDNAGPYGDHATLNGTGGDVGDFEVSTCVPEAMTPTSDWTALMEARAAGEDVTLEWSNPLPNARIYVRMTTGIGTHGGISPVEVECEGLDTGSLTLPGAYLDQLFADGWGCGECGDNKLFRYYSGDAAITPGTLRFRGEAMTYFFFHP